MARAIQIQGIAIATIGTAVTRYMPLADSWLDFNQNIAESSAQTTYRIDGTLRNLWCRVETNSRNGSSTIRVRKNLSDGSMILTIPASTTGQFEDTVNTDSVVSGDALDLQLIVGGSSGTTQFRAFRTLFDATTNTAKKHACAASAGSSVTNTFYLAPGGRRDADNTAEDRAQAYFGVAGTLRNLFVNVSANTRNGSSTFRSRINGTNGTQLITVPSTTTGLFEDLVNSDAISLGNLVAFQWVNGGSSGTLTPNVISAEFESTESGSIHVWARPGGGNSIGEAALGSMCIGGEHNAFQGSDPRVQAKTGIDGAFRRLSIFLSLNSFDFQSVENAGTITLEINSADSLLAITILSGQTGRLTNVTNSVPVVPTDLVNYSVLTNVGDGLGILVFRTVSMSMIFGSAVPPTVFEAMAIRGFEQSAERAMFLSTERRDLVTYLKGDTEDAP